VTLSRTWVVNGEQRTVRFAPLARLLDVIREQLGLLGAKEGCGEGECGACSVVLDGELHLACLTAAAQVDDGAALLTAEGLEDLELGRSLKEAFDRQGAVQCGYCSPAMLLGGYALLSENPSPTEEQVRAALAGHLCRCTGYSTIVAAVQDAGRRP
jgi:aerobic-type carbon monoxide dehydrogenase small subunit (CoxS/CutS family)